MSTPKTALPPILKQPAEIKTLIASFLETRELKNLSETCQSFHISFRKTMSSKGKTSKLLTHIFNADPKSVEEMISYSEAVDDRSAFPVRMAQKIRKVCKDYQNFMAKQVLPEPPQPKIDSCIVLDKSCCKEEYFSASKKKMMLKRTWKHISPLEAAAWCGDNFIVIILLQYVPPSQRLEAVQQLQGILDRKETEENGGYLAPFNALLKAYQTYTKLDIKAVKGVLDVDDKGKNLDKMLKKYLWDQVWMCQRKLPTYGLQEYCDDKHFDYNLSFEQEPRRAVPAIKNYKGKLFLFYHHLYRSFYSEPIQRLFQRGYIRAETIDRLANPFYRKMIAVRYDLDLDNPKGIALYKGPAHMYSKRPFAGTEKIDFNAIKHLCNVRTEELKNIIKELKQSSVLIKSEEDEPRLESLRI